jgi:Protein of unknown function (DUF3592)
VRSWAQTIGQIDSSKAVARDVRSKEFRATGTGSSSGFETEEKIQTRNFAEITYSFTIGGKTYRSSRIGLASGPNFFNVAATLKRYPQGKSVTVFYNPNNPSESILEREDPRNMRKGWFAIAILTALILAGFFAITEGAEGLRHVIVDPKRIPVVIGLIVASLIMLVAARMMTKQTRAMKKWPKAAGRIVQSEVITSVHHRERTGQGFISSGYDQTYYAPRIVYSYQADGNSFEGDNIGWSGSAGTPALAEKYVRRFPLHAEVQVFYNPDDPTRSTLAPTGGLLALGFLAAAAVFAFAAFGVGWLIP